MTDHVCELRIKENVKKFCLSLRNCLIAQTTATVSHKLNCSPFSKQKINEKKKKNRVSLFLLLIT